MSLSDKQRAFSQAVGKLIGFAYENGYGITFGDAYATSGHIDGSFHYKRLAIDLNLFKDGKYLTDTESYRPLGTHWKQLGGTWGGDFNDGNHFSWGEGK